MSSTVSGKPSRVLAFGAAGSAAGEVIPALAARDVPVRGLVRHEEQRQAVLGRGADQVALGDLADRDSIQAGHPPGAEPGLRGYFEELDAQGQAAGQATAP
jgi:nucleoside-diphosphate-sugar epimerase